MSWTEKKDAAGRRKGRSGERGSTAIELAIVATLIALGTTLAAGNISASRDAVRLRNSAVILTRYFEKARGAAIRCHCTATVQIVDGSNYGVAGVLTGSGVNQTVNVTLAPNITFGTAPMTITYNWRGRADTSADIVLNSPRESTTVNVAGGGDVSIDTPFDSSYTPPISATNLTNDISIDAVAATQKFTGQGSVNGNVVNARNHRPKHTK